MRLLCKFKSIFKVKPVLEHATISNIMTYLGTEPGSRFTSEIVILTENNISVILPTLETITNC